MLFANRSLTSKLALILLPLSMALYAASLTMNVANVAGVVRLDSKAIERELVGELQREVPVDAISNQISRVIYEVVSDRFPMFASQSMYQTIRGAVREKVDERGSQMIASVVPDLDIPQPAPDLRGVKLIQTIKDLWNSGTAGDAFLAACLVAFTIFFPITKYIALVWLLFLRAGAPARERVLTWLKSWGQWSMGDVFVVAFMVVLTKINTSVVSTSTLADISVRVGVEPGLYFFAASVMLGMICSMLVTAADREMARAERAATAVPPVGAFKP